MAEESTWKTVVLIPKKNGNFRGISLVEVLWKTGTVILNLHLGTVIAFHNVLHGFHNKRGIGNNSIEANVLQNMMAMR